MDGRLAQLAALVAHGNAWLAGDRTGPSAVAAGTTFQYVNDVSFTSTTGRVLRRRFVTRDPTAWLQGLAERGVASLWLDPRPANFGRLPAWIAAAFANSTGSSILAVGPRAERWIGGWTVGRAQAPDNRIWDVRYFGSSDRGELGRIADTRSAHGRLVRAVTDAGDFARRLGWTEWVRWFDDALRAGQSTAPAARFHDDALAPSAGMPRRQLFALASGAYVFGGMGSWSDMLPPDPADGPEFRRISAELFAAVLDGVAAAVNPTSPRS